MTFFALRLFETASVTPFGNHGEEVVALIINKDEGGEVLNLDFPHCLHAKFRILKKFYFLDRILGKDCGRAADRAEIETSVSLAGIGYLLAAVALGDHHQRAAECLERLNIRIHASGGSGSERAGRHSFGSLGRTGIIHGVILEVFGHGFSAVNALLDLGMGYVAGHDNGAVE